MYIHMTRHIKREINGKTYSRANTNTVWAFLVKSLQGGGERTRERERERLGGRKSGDKRSGASTSTKRKKPISDLITKCGPNFLRTRRTYYN